MKKDQVAAKRYADAFVSFARTILGIGDILSDFRSLKRVCEDNPELIQFLQSAGVPFSEKNKFIDTVLEGECCDAVRQFLKFLLSNGRIDKTVDIAEYIITTYSHENESTALIKTALFLEPETIKAIKDKVEKKLQKKIKLYIDLDPSLLGGVQVIVGNTVIDGSMRKRITQLREQLMQAKVN